MKIFSAKQIKEWDQYTIVNEPVASIDLMERAAQQCTDWLTNIEIDHHPIKIFCGKGNNGGDGLAIARQLAEQGIFSRVYILDLGSEGSIDYQENLQRLQQRTNETYFVNTKNAFPIIKTDDLVIDALFGTGLNRPLDGLSEELVKHINQAKALVVSIDIPSGMFADKFSENDAIIHADHTLTFQIPKLAFLLPENEKYVGELHVFDIALHKQFSTDNESPYQFIDKELVISIYKPRKIFAHKGTFGHALMIAGSKGKMGAAHLAAKACLRSGVGLLSCLVPEEGLLIIQTSVPEAMCLTQIEEASWDSYAAIGIGPGLGKSDEAKIRVETLLNNYNKPIVIDADGLNILSNNKQLLHQLPENSILTPHPKEYERLFGKTSNSFERVQNALSNAKKLKSYIIIKGHYSFIACPDGEGYFNSTGNPGMATAGSGDVLTGILTALLAQGYDSKESCILGVFLHGLAGDIAAATHSQESMIAGDIVECLSQGFQKISRASFPNS